MAALICYSVGIDPLKCWQEQGTWAAQQRFRVEYLRSSEGTQRDICGCAIGLM